MSLTLLPLRHPGVSNDEFYFVIYLRRCPKGVIYLRRCPKGVISKWLVIQGTGFDPVTSGLSAPRAAYCAIPGYIQMMIFTLSSTCVDALKGSSQSGWFTGGRDRTYDLGVMSTACYHCTTPVYQLMIAYFVIYLRRCPKGVIYLRRCPKGVISKWLNTGNRFWSCALRIMSPARFPLRHTG